MNNPVDIDGLAAYFTVEADRLTRTARSDNVRGFITGLRFAAAKVRKTAAAYTPTKRETNVRANDETQTQTHA